MILFFYNDTASTEIYTLSLHDALPICFQIALLDLLPFMGRMDTLLDQGTGLLSNRTRLSKAYLRKAANGKEVLLALQAILPSPELAAGGLDQQEQAPAV